MQTQTLNISLPKDLVKRIDSFAKKEYRNRSEFIREAVRIYLKDLEDWDGRPDYVFKDFLEAVKWMTGGDRKSVV